MKCVICNSNLNEKPEYCLDEKCLILLGDCNHSFHKDCLDTWFRRIQKTDCPLCKKIFMVRSVLKTMSKGSSACL